MARYSFTDEPGRSYDIYYATHMSIGGTSQYIGGADITALDGEDTVFIVDSLANLDNFPTDDRLDLGDGNDSGFGGSGNDTILGGNGDDDIRGDFALIQYIDYDLADHYSGVGNDLLDGGEGNDELIGGAGKDTLIGGLGDDYLGGDDYTFDGETRIDGPDSADKLDGGGGKDTLAAFAGDTALGGAGDDYFYAFLLDGASATAHMTLNGGAGTDTVRFKLDVDFDVNYAFGDSHLINISLAGIEQVGFLELLGAGSDSLIGTPLADQISEGGGTDTIETGDGNDFIFKDRGVAGFSLGRDNDNVVIGATASGKVDLGAGDDSLTATIDSASPFDVRPDSLLVIGGAGNDRLTPTSPGVYVFRPGAGDDTIIATASSPFNDLTTRPDDERQITVDYSDAKAGVDIDLAAGTAAGGSGTDAIPLVDDVIGSQFADLIIGDDTGNNLDGGSGADSIAAADGDDLLDGGRGFDTLDGGAGDDTVQAGLENDSVDGGTGADSINGDDGDDSIAAGGGNDFTAGGEGDDTLIGGGGNDTINGGGGVDVVNYLEEQGTKGIKVFLAAGKTSTDSFGGTDRLVDIESIRGTLLNDTITGDGAANSFNGSAGNDRLDGAGGKDNLVGSAGDDALSGGAGDDLLSGGADDDSLDGGAGTDDLAGNAGGDTLNGAAGDDVLAGGDGNDILSDTTIARSNVDFDWLAAVAGKGDAMDGGNGADQLYGAGSLDGGAGNDTVKGIGFLDGGTGDDVLTVKSVPGVDGILPKLIGGLGADELHGALQAIASYEYSKVGVKVSLELGTAAGAAGDRDTLSGLNQVWGSDFGDTLTGANGKTAHLLGLDGDDTLRGLSGADDLQGGDGGDVISTGKGGSHDTVSGGAGDDTITAQGFDGDLDGGGGNDRFVFDGISAAAAGGAGADTFVVVKGGANITGGAGVDRYVVMDGDVDVAITGFDRQTERIDLTDFHIKDFAALKALGHNFVGFVRFDLGPDAQLQFENMVLSQLQANDFLL